MKKLSIFIFVLFFIQFAFAVPEIDMDDEFKQGETLIAKVSGNFFKPLSSENIIFYKGHVRTSIPFSVEKINNLFYIYGQLLDKSPNNYSIVLENSKYFQGSQVIEEDITKNFTINENIADFSIDKGFVVTKEDFSIEVKNLQDKEITVNTRVVSGSESSGFLGVSFGEEKAEGDSVNIRVGKTKNIDFEIGEDLLGLKTIELSTENLKYEIPVLVLENEESEKVKNFRFNPSFSNVSMATNSDTVRIIYLENTGDSEIENILVRISDTLIPYITLSTEMIDSLDIGSSEKIELNISSSPEENKIEGQIEVIALDDELNTQGSIFLDFIKDYVPTSETCSELNGVICSENQKCDTENIEYASDGVCCLGTCQEIKKSSTGKIIGWLILLSVLGFGVWFYLKKYKKVESVSDLMRFIKRQ